MKRIFTSIFLVAFILNNLVAQEWVEMASGLGGGSESVRTVVIDPSGNIYAGGTFTGAVNYLARWNGSAWVSVGGGVNGPVYSIGIKSASDIYVGGEFTDAGGVVVNNIARWNGLAWSDVDSGFNAKVKCVYASPSGTVYAGGEFTQTGQTFINHFAKLQNNQWVSVGNGIGGVVNTITEHNSMLYAGSDVPNGSVHQFDGSNWNSVSGVPTGKTFALASFNNYLYAGGDYQLPIPAAARWDGSTWSTIMTNFNPGHRVNAFHVRAGILYVGGNFTNVGLGNPNYIGRVTSGSSPVLEFTASSDLTGGEVFSITNLNGKVVAGGTFVTPTNPATNNISITSTTISVEEINSITELNFFPNPVHSEARISMTTEKPLRNPELKIYDVQSRLVNIPSLLMQQSDKTEFSFDCAGLAHGNYSYQVIDGNTIIVSEKFVVE